MKIIIVGTAFPYRGGLAAFNERLAREFVKEGNDVELMTFSLQYPGFLVPDKKQYSSESSPKDLKITRLINVFNPYNWLKVANVIRKAKPDLVIFSYWNAVVAPCFGSIARNSKLPKTRLVGLIHNIVPPEPMLADRKLPSYFVRSMGSFVSMAESVSKDIAIFDAENKPKVVTPHPIYDHYGNIISRREAAIKLGLNDQNKYVLFFGLIRHYKGLDLLLEAFADSRLRELPVRLIIAGEFYENPQPYLEKIIRLNLESHIELRADFVPDNDVKNFFSIADLVAQPYRSGNQSGITQIAYHFETPMLVTKVGGLADLVQHDKVGYVVDVEPKHIADALVDYFLNNKSAEFVENIRIQKQNFQWSSMTTAIYEIIKQ
jgi:D-inositol-3-phosphate glycosyltransferase